MKVFIIIIAIIGLAAVAGPIIVGIKSFDGTVTDNSYEEGLRWDEVRNSKNESGWKVEILEKELSIGENELNISVIGKKGDPLLSSSLSLKISRPATTAYDRYINSDQYGERVFRSQVNFPLFGYWDVEVNVTKGDETHLFKKRVFVEKGGDDL